MCPHCLLVACGALVASVPALRYVRGRLESRRSSRQDEQPSDARRDAADQEDQEETP